MNKEQSKQVLIEELGVYFETEYDLPPLAARIFANLVVTDEDGLPDYTRDILLVSGLFFGEKILSLNRFSSLLIILHLILQLLTIAFFRKILFFS